MKWKDVPQNRRIYCKTLSDEELVSKIYEELQKRNHKNGQNNPNKNGEKVWTDISQTAKKHMKRCSTANVTMNYKVKQWNTTAHPHVVKTQTLATPNADEDEEQQELSFTDGGDTEWYRRWGYGVVQTVGNTEWYSQAGTQLGSFSQSWTQSTIQSNNCVPRYSAQRVECVFTQNPQITVYSSLIHNCQKLKATRISFKAEWISKMWHCQMTEDYSAIKWKEFLNLKRHCYCCCLVAKLCLTVLGTLWTVAHQAPLSMGFPRQECWSGLPFSLQGIFAIQGLNSSLALAGDNSLPLSHLRIRSR